MLTDRGLDAALSALAARSPVPVDVLVDAGLAASGRCSPTVEATAYFVVAEALTNVAKHSHATTCRVSVTSGGASREDALVRVEIHDNGVGGASLGKGHGLAGLSDRVAAVDGSLSVSSPQGGPTVVSVALPIS